MTETSSLSFLAALYRPAEPKITGQYSDGKPMYGISGGSGELADWGVDDGESVVVAPRIVVPEGSSDERNLFDNLEGGLGDLSGGAVSGGPQKSGGGVLEEAREEHRKEAGAGEDEEEFEWDLGEAKEKWGDKLKRKSEAALAAAIVAWIRGPVGRWGLKQQGKIENWVASRKSSKPASGQEGDTTVIEERRGFFNWLSEVSRGAKEMLGERWEKTKSWLGRLGKKEQAEDDSRLLSGGKIKAWRPKVTGEQAGRFLKFYGVNAISLAIGAVVGAEFGQNAPLALETAGMTMFVVGQVGLMMGKERGMTEIADTEPKFKRVINAVQRACSNSAVRTGLRIARSGGLGLAITTAPDFLRHLTGVEAAAQAPAGIDQAVNPPVVRPPVEPASGWQSVDQARALGNQAAQQVHGLAAQSAAQEAARAAAEQAAQVVAQAAEAARIATEQAAQQAVAQAAEAARIAMEQAAQQQQAAVDALKTGQTMMAEMAKSMPQGTAHEVVYEAFRHIPGLQNHVGEATQALLNSLRANYGAEQGEQIFRSLPQGAVEAVGNKLAELFRSVPKGVLPYQFGGADNVMHQLLQGANLSLDHSQGLQGARDIFDDIVRPTIGAILP